VSTATADDLLAQALSADGALWVFGYGSLMWRPGFSFEEVVTARLHGFHRSLCILSVHWRGTEACPGLVFGLDRGGSCQGRAFRVAAERAAGVLAELDAREMTHGVYRHAVLPVAIPGGTVRALAYIVRRDHPHYAGRLDSATRLRLIAQGHGQGGACRDYVLSTHAHLEAIGIRDRPLARLARTLAACPA
jgi:glutathione-specific gamma-glutamylcyclotransferase